MAATKINEINNCKTMLKLGARPPRRLTRDEKEFLQNLQPSKKMMEVLSKIPPLKIVDGKVYGF